MPDGRFFEEFEVGQEFETAARVIDAADVAAFAEVSGDYNPLHMDEAYARGTVFGERVAHGILGLAVASGLVNATRLTRGTLVALLGVRWDFVKPVRLGTEVRCRLRVVGVHATSRADRGRVTLGVELVDGVESVLQRGEWQMLVRRRSAPGRGSGPG